MKTHVTQPQAQRHITYPQSPNAAYAVPPPQSDGSDYLRPVPRGEPVRAQRTVANHYRHPPVHEPDNGYLRVPERYQGREILKADQSALPYRREAYIPGPDPKWTPPPVYPVTEHASYRFFRPGFGLQVPYPLINTGAHFSMADHRRNYPVLGMEPVAERRNTYRTDPPPRDVTIQDRPPPASPTTPQAVYYSPSAGYSMFGASKRTYRL
jgi:hypothetical protein